MTALVIYGHGGPEQFRRIEESIEAPEPGLVRVRHTAIGCGYLDVDQRRGRFGPHPLPLVLGHEGVGIVEAAGDGVESFEPGQRVFYVDVRGAYRERRLVPADRLLALPADLDDEVVAAVARRGMMADILAHRVCRLSERTAVLVHAAAGGVGQLVCQLARHFGATVIGVVGSDSKVEAAQAAGCAHVIVGAHEDFVERVREITGGHGVAVVFDSVGRDTFLRSLDCLRRGGTAISFGTTSGEVQLFPLSRLEARSLAVARPSLASWISTRAELEIAAGRLFEMLRSGRIRVDIRHRYALGDVAMAHRDLENRRTIGPLVLVP